MNQEDMMSQIYGLIRDHAAQHGRTSDDGQLRMNYNQAEAMVQQSTHNSTRNSTALYFYPLLTTLTTLHICFLVSNLNHYIHPTKYLPYLPFISYPCVSHLSITIRY